MRIIRKPMRQSFKSKILSRKRVFADNQDYDEENLYELNDGDVDIDVYYDLGMANDDFEFNFPEIKTGSRDYGTEGGLFLYTDLGNIDPKDYKTFGEYAQDAGYRCIKSSDDIPLDIPDWLADDLNGYIGDCYYNPVTEDVIYDEGDNIFSIRSWEKIANELNNLVILEVTGYVQGAVSYILIDKDIYKKALGSIPDAKTLRAIEDEIQHVLYSGFLRFGVSGTGYDEELADSLNGDFGGYQDYNEYAIADFLRKYYSDKFSKNDLDVIIRSLPDHPEYEY